MYEGWTAWIWRAEERIEEIQKRENKIEKWHPLSLVAALIRQIPSNLRINGEWKGRRAPFGNWPAPEHVVLCLYGPGLLCYILYQHFLSFCVMPALNWSLNVAFVSWSYYVVSFFITIVAFFLDGTNLVPALWVASHCEFSNDFGNIICRFVKSWFKSQQKGTLE